MPRGTGWFLGAFLVCVGIALAVVAKSKNGPAALAALAVMLLMFSVLRLLPLWMVVFAVIAIVGAGKLASDRRQGGYA